MLGYRVEKAQSMMGLACEMDNLALKSTRDSLWNRENTRRCFVDANNEYVINVKINMPKNSHINMYNLSC